MKPYRMTITAKLLSGAFRRDTFLYGSNFLSLFMAIQIRAYEQHFRVILNVNYAVEVGSLDITLVCDH